MTAPLREEADLSHRAAPAGARTVVIGGGPAGLTAAWELARLGLPAVVLEKDDTVGGIARTVSYRGYRFDIGGHRFFTKVGMVRELWEEMLGEDLLSRPRLSRIHYRGRFFDYPLRPWNALAGLGSVEALRIVASYVKAQVARKPGERTFEEWVVNRFGRRLYEIFFKSYTEKVWGIPCHEIGADWAAQRIKDLDLVAAMRNALLGSAGGGAVVTTLIDRFHYPRLGPGMMWERCSARLAERGVETRLGCEVRRLERDEGGVRAAVVARGGREERVEGEHFISSMPLSALVRALDPPAPPEALAAAGRLRYRDFLTVMLIVRRAETFPDNWIYVHSPEVRVGRIQNFKNWSPDMVPDPATTSLGLEYFVQEGDALWRASEEELVALGTRELATLGLVEPREVIDGTVVRMPKAYPVYDGRYLDCVRVLRGFLDGIPNLQTIGRNGQHRYNNQDHSMVTGVYAARNVDGAGHDVWAVNVDGDYHEEVRGAEEEELRGFGDGEVRRPAGEDVRRPADERRRAEEGRESVRGDRLVPARAPRRTFEEALREVFAVFDPVALGTAVGVVGAGGLLLVTAATLLAGGGDTRPLLGLLGNYLFGYTVTWRGALVGILEASLVGFAFGYLLARAINLLVRWDYTLLRRSIQLQRALESVQQTREGIPSEET